jgi:transcription elongation factor GreB
MSRAFVDESASESSEENAPELKIPLPAGAKNYMTPGGARRLRAELDSLLAMAQPRLRETERRIQYLSRMAAIMEVVEPGFAAPDRVTFGVSVTVTERGGEESTYRIVGVDESAPEKGLVSWISPIARALTGKKPGDAVTVRLPAGEKVLTVRSIRGDDGRGADTPAEPL